MFCVQHPYPAGTGPSRYGPASSHALVAHTASHAAVCALEPAMISLIVGTMLLRPHARIMSAPYGHVPRSLRARSRKAPRRSVAAHGAPSPGTTNGVSTS